MSFGCQIRNSDFGSSKLDMKFYSLQPICMNGLVRESQISVTHLGKRNDNIKLSNETMELETKYYAGVVSDSVKQLLNPEYLKKEAKKIQAASSIPVDFETEIKKLPKVKVSDSEKETLEGIFMQRKKEDGVIGEPSLWSFVQGLSAVGNYTDSGVRKRELAELAGTFLKEL